MKRYRPLFWRLYPSYLLITVAAIFAVSVHTTITVKAFFLQTTSDDLVARARLMEHELVTDLAASDTEAVDRVCKRAGRRSGTRITVILPSGQVAADSDEDPKIMVNHGGRPEVMEAFARKTGTSVRYSETLQKNMMYVAVPLIHDGGLLAVVRTAIPVDTIDRTLSEIRNRKILSGFVIALLAAGVVLIVSRWIIRPIDAIRIGAEEYARGNLRYRVPAPESREMVMLVKAMNRMAEDLDDRIQTVIRQRNEIDAVLSSMQEGVIALDMDERLIRMNQAAASIFGRSPQSSVGRSIQEVVRTPDMHRFVAEALTAGDRAEAEITIYMEEERIISAHSSMLRDSGDNRIGTVIVFHDITRLRRLENIRQDFAANVSHEIKTPLTAIKGFVETLLNGAAYSPDEALRFLGIIDKHVHRLTLIIEDLMKLSEIEQKGKNHEIPLEAGSIGEVMAGAVEVCRAKASEKHIILDMACPSRLTAPINGHFLEQAVVNLIDNAIKYGKENSIVSLHAERADDEILIRVQDHGMGIPQSHLPRLFERFYRVDQSRSRKEGGTGLGLAIVKHIAQAHGGKVTVESTLSEGSTFTIHLPSGDGDR